MGVASLAQPYGGDDNRIIPIPLVNYLGRSLTIAGPRIEYEVGRRDWIRFSVLGRYRFAGYDAKDSPRLTGMEDRDDTLEVGFALRHDLFDTQVTLRAQLTADVLDKHGGAELELALNRTFRTGRWALSPSLGTNIQSSDLAGYYFGVEPSEATAARSAYDPGSAVNPYVGLTATYQASANWLLIANVNVELLDDEITDSPIVEDDVLGRLFLGLVYSL